MIQSTLRHVAEVIGANAPGHDASFTGVSTDTRTMTPGALYVALNGPNFSGGDFVPAARDAGAAGAIVDAYREDALPQLTVADTHEALIRLARDWRARMSPLTIGITGSNGKTTMRSLIAACCGDHTLATEGNLNNDIGVPLMLLRLSPEHKRAVFEMGANHAGEIALLTDMVDPSIGIITNAGPAHLEGFGSIEGVAHAKGELFDALGEGDTAIINADDQYVTLWRELSAPASIVTFGSTPSADVWFDDYRALAEAGIQFTLHAQQRQVRVHMQLSGRHNALNACGAAATALAAGIALDDIVAALATVAAEPGRLAPRTGRHGATIIDDSYNANPASMVAAGEALAATTAHPWMVIGDMGELGNDSDQMHYEVGQQLRDAGVERLFAFGPSSAKAVAGFGEGASHYDDIQALIDSVSAGLHDGLTVLVKGSRSMRMERVVEQLLSSRGGQ